MKKKVILSCPFCGSTEVEICRTNEFACWICCGSCGAASESNKTRAGAIKNWNRRFPPKQATVVDDQDKDRAQYYKGKTSTRKEAHNG
jgi:Lar family restriction alleviation protein